MYFQINDGVNNYLIKYKPIESKLSRFKLFLCCN
jgi:hypothetical protein